MGHRYSDAPDAEVNPAPQTTPEGTPPATGFAPADADALRNAITAAVDAAGGVGATEIEVEVGGYDVEVQRADGSEVEVFVTVDLHAIVREVDDDDDDPLINLDQLADLVRISLDTAGGGTIESISTDDDDDHFYDVDVRLGGGSEVEIELDNNLTVLEVDRD